MGSTHLVWTLREQGTHCVEKPNINAWFPKDFPVAIRDEPAKPAFASLDVLPRAGFCKRFLWVQNRMSDAPERFELDPEKTIAANMADYFAFLRSHGTACVLEGAGLNGLLADGGQRNVVFLIRDPIQAYISCAKPKRHGRYFEQLGGMESDEAIAFWCWGWNCLADEYLKSKKNGLDPVLVRYESAEADVAHLESPFLTKVFATFRPNTNEVHLSASAQRRVLEGLGDRYGQIYGEDPADRLIGTSLASPT
jgi:hypothetical protein